MPGTGSDPNICSGKGVVVHWIEYSWAESYFLRVQRAYFAVTRDEDLSGAGTGAGHQVAGYRKGGWSGKKGILGGRDQNGRDPPGTPGRR